MNQIFRITVGQDTLQGRLPAVRVGMGYCCRFHIFGIAYASGIVPPKIWIAVDGDTLYWTGVWNSTVGAWVIDVNTEATAVAGATTYALTAFAEDTTREYLVGQAAFVVFTTIVGGETGATGGTAGASLSVRLAAVGAWMETFVDLPTFDPETGVEFEMREQIQTITNRLRGT